MTPHGATPERRRNYTLREVLDEFVGHARSVTTRAKSMTPEELERAQERLEWLADEVWRVATERQPPPE
jgi:DNA gyrase/topoisomerase IV subunit A